MPEMGAKEQAVSLDEEEVVIVMEIAEMVERSRKDKLPALRNVPKKKLLEETAKVDKVLSKFKTHSITKTNELFYARAVVVTNRLGVKIDKVAIRHWGRYSIKVKRLNVVTEELKLRITAIATKVRRYQGRVDSYRQNSQFDNEDSFIGN